MHKKTDEPENLGKILIAEYIYSSIYGSFTWILFLYRIRHKYPPEANSNYIYGNSLKVLQGNLEVQHLKRCGEPAEVNPECWDAIRSFRGLSGVPIYSSFNFRTEDNLHAV